MRKAGLLGLRGAWPWPSAEAWTILAVFGTVQAVLQLGLPGAEHKGPVSPKGNVPIYKVMHHLCCLLSALASVVAAQCMPALVEAWSRTGNNMWVATYVIA